MARDFSHSAFAEFLRAIARCVCKGRRWFIYPQILLAIVCAVYTWRFLKLDQQRENLIGANRKSQVVMRAYRKEFPGEGDQLVVVVKSGGPERNRQFIERLAAKIKPETNVFRDLFYKADLSTLGPKGLLLASTNDLENLRERIQKYQPWLEQFGQASNLDSLFALVNQNFRNSSRSKNQGGRSMVKAIPSLESVITRGREAVTYLGHPASLEVETLLAGNQPQARQNIYVTAEEGRVYLLTVRPKSEDLSGQAIERLRALVEAARPEIPGVAVGVTGGPVLDYDEMRQAESDTSLASVIAFIICAALFIGAYRQVSRPLKAAFCLLIGMAYALGFTTLAVGRLNILSITFAPMLIGLAIDFGIHFISRYEEEMRNRRTPAQAVESATAFTGQGIITGALTTAGAFLAMALTNFKGIREVGIICGGGLLLCLVPMMTTLPALLMRGRQNLLDARIGPSGERRRQIEYLWLRHPVSVISVTLLLCVAAAFYIHRVDFDYDLLHMQNQSLPSVMYEKELVQSAGGSSLFGAVIADSAGQAREYESALRQLPAVASVRSAADFLDEDQARKLELVRAIQKELAAIHLAPVDRRPVDVQSLSATLWYLKGYLGMAGEAAQMYAPDVARTLGSLGRAITRFRVAILQPEPDIQQKLTEYQQGLFDNLRRTIDAMGTQDTSGPMRPQDLPAVLRNRFIGVTGKYVVQVYPRQDLWQHANQKVFIDELRSVIPANQVTGEPVNLYEYTTLLKDSYEQAARYAFVAIVAMLLIHFGSVTMTLLALLPVAIGTVWLLGFMGLTGIDFNPANIMTLPLVLGIGVTNGVQILNRFAEEQEPSIFSKSTGKAVLVSGLTAITGFGSLMVAGHPGIRSLGFVMSFGIAACMVAALAILPALLRIMLRREQRLGEPTHVPGLPEPRPVH